MKLLLHFTVIHIILVPAYTSNGVVWDRHHQEFIPIRKIPIFSRILQEHVAKSREKETHDFGGKRLKLASVEHKNIFDWDNNNEIPSGLVAELWYTLSDYLNFTIVPIQTKFQGIGTTRRENETGGPFTGLLGAVFDNKIDVIGQVQMFSKRLEAIQYTYPLWRSRNRLYIRHELKYNVFWMTQLFSWKVWCAISITYLLLVICTFISQRIAARTLYTSSHLVIADHVFYTFAVICGQSFIPDGFCGRCRVLEFSMSMFSNIIRIAFGALLISYITNGIFLSPFYDFDSLIDHSSYKIVIASGSLSHIVLTKVAGYERPMQMNRVVVVPTLKEMYEKVCLSETEYTMLQSDDVKKARGSYICRLHSVGRAYFESWTASGLPHDFAFKRTIDLGILKLHEVGIIEELKNRWMESNANEDGEKNTSKPIVWQQVVLIQVTFLFGIFIAIVICALENVIFYLKYHGRL